MFLLGTNVKQWQRTVAGLGRSWPEVAEVGRTSRVAVTLRFEIRSKMHCFNKPGDSLEQNEIGFRDFVHLFACLIDLFERSHHSFGFFDARYRSAPHFRVLSSHALRTFLARASHLSIISSDVLRTLFGRGSHALRNGFRRDSEDIQKRFARDSHEVRMLSGFVAVGLPPMLGAGKSTFK